MGLFGKPEKGKEFSDFEKAEIDRKAGLFDEMQKGEGEEKLFVSPPSTPKTKKCPYCKEEVLIDAKKEKSLQIILDQIKP